MVELSEVEYKRNRKGLIKMFAQSIRILGLRTNIRHEDTAVRAEAILILLSHHRD